MNRHLASLTAMTLLSFAGQSMAEEVALCSLQRLSDGDSGALYCDGREVPFRLGGIDAPESAQTHGNQSHGMALDLMQGQQLRIRQVGRPSYGRMVVAITINARDLASDLVRQGAVWCEPRYPSVKGCSELEANARAAGRGLWASPNPQPPWEFRRFGPRSP